MLKGVFAMGVVYNHQWLPGIGDDFESTGYTRNRLESQSGIIKLDTMGEQDCHRTGEIQGVVGTDHRAAELGGSPRRFELKDHAGQ